MGKKAYANRKTHEKQHVRKCLKTCWQRVDGGDSKFATLSNRGKRKGTCVRKKAVLEKQRKLKGNEQDRAIRRKS